MCFLNKNYYYYYFLKIIFFGVSAFCGLVFVLFCCVVAICLFVCFCFVFVVNESVHMQCVILPRVECRVIDSHVCHVVFVLCCTTLASSFFFFFFFFFF